MKKVYRSIVFAAAVFSFCSFLPSDDCGMYIAPRAGMETEYKTYDEKDKLTGTNKSKVLAVRDGGKEVEVSAESFDKKDKSVATSTYVVKCENGNFVIDMRAMVPQESMAGFKDMKVTVEADKLDIPSNPEPGQSLKNGTIKISSVSEGSPINMNLTMTVSNRKVEAVEDVTVPLGVFPCVKITYDAEVKMLFTVKTKVVEWYSKNVGLIKSQTFNTKDKLVGYTILNSRK